MQRSTRRRFLVGAAATGTLSGCLSALPPGSGGSGSSSTGPALQTLDVGGSPGETVPVRPDGQVVLLDFFATWCGPCKPQMDSLRAIRAAFPDVHMLSVTWESDEAAVESFWQNYEGTWPVANDPEVRTGERYGVDRIPTLLVFDPDGQEEWRHVGLASDDGIAEQLRAAGAGG